MRYILDNEGYVKVCSKTEIVCESKTCTAYEGDVPEGYETIEEWVQNANINAYKVVDGQLVYDADKDEELQQKYDDECTLVPYIMANVPTLTYLSANNKVPFIILEQKGNCFSVVNGQVVVGKDVKKVRVTARIGGGTTTGRLWARIMHNDNRTMGSAIAYGTYVTSSCDIILNVKEGDTIGAIVTEAFNIYDGGVDCYIIVEKIG